MTDMSQDERTAVVVVDRAGYDRYRLPDGRPVLDPERHRVTLITNPGLVGQVRPGECAEVLGADIDRPETTADLIRTVHRAHPVHRVVAFPENLLVPVAEVRHELGLAGPTVAEIVPFRDKSVMKRAAADGGITVADWVPVDGPADVDGLFAEHGSIVVKPRAGAGSAGVNLIRSATELREFLERTTDLTSLQAEEFIDAPMIHIDAVVRNGCVVAAVTSRYLSSTLAHVSGQPLPSVVTDDPGLLDAAGSLLKRVVEAFRIVDAVLHLEAFVRPDELVFNEVACRAGGGGIVSLLQAMTGINLFEAMIRMALGEPLTAYPVTARTGGFVLLYGGPGVLDGVDDSAVPADWVVERKIAVAPGERFTPVGRAGGSLASYVLRGTSEAEVQGRVRTVLDEVRISLSDG